MTKVLDANEAIGASLFEVNTAVAFLAFANTPADACILEVGLGGRLDATNVVDRPASCGIASIGIDHEAFLGSDLSTIAAEKAGIAKRGVPLVCLSQADLAEQSIEQIARKIGAPLFLEGREWRIDPELRPALAGPHQVRNANLAWQMICAQSAIAVTREQYLAGLAGAKWPARFQRLSDGPLVEGKETWLDGAHNPDAAAALAAILATWGPMHLILGILANKNAGAIVDLLRPHALSLTFVPVPDHDSHDPHVMAARYDGRAAEGVEAALKGLPEPRLIAGSLYLAGEVLRLNGELPD
jgi:dihydrofolate synthase/folylpolyglutamate synthase